MDRREALTKLVAGGVVTVGAASIISSPAFALITTVSPTVDVQNGPANKVATFTVVLQNPICSGGSDGTGTVALVSASFVAAESTGTVSDDGQSLTALATNQAGKFVSGDTAQVRVTTTSTCTFSNIPDESAAGGPYDFDFSYDGANWT